MLSPRNTQDSPFESASKPFIELAQINEGLVPSIDSNECVIDVEGEVNGCPIGIRLGVQARVAMRLLEALLQ